MVLSKRERYILIAVTITLGLLALDLVIVSPMQKRADEAQSRSVALTIELENAATITKQRRALLPMWQQMTQNGLGLTPGDAETKVLQSIHDWARQSGLTIAALRPERVVEREGLKELTIQASGTGGMEAVSGFLNRLETATLPVRVSEVQIGTRKEGTNELSIQLRISALCGAVAPSGKVAISGTTVVAQPAPSWEHYKTIAEWNIFLRDRSTPSRSTPRTTTTVIAPQRDFILSGIVKQDEEFLAFVENARTAGAMRLKAGDSVAEGRIASISMDGVVFEVSGETRAVPVGGRFDGSATAAPPPIAAGSGGSGGAPVDEAAVLERLRQRRQSEINRNDPSVQ